MYPRGGLLDLEMEPGSFQRSPPHRNGRHRLDPGIYMLRSTLYLPVAPARAPEMSHRGSSVECQKGVSKRVARWSRNGSQNGPESVDNFVKGSLGAALEVQGPLEESLRSLNGPLGRFTEAYGGRLTVFHIILLCFGSFVVPYLGCIRPWIVFPFSDCTVTALGYWTALCFASTPTKK